VSPPGYRHSYSNVNINVNQSIVASSEKYYSRFGNNQNLRGTATRSPLANAKPVDRQALARQAKGQAGMATQAGQSRVGQTGGPDPAETWRGQSTYAGQGDRAASDAFNQAAAEAAAFAKARQAAAQRRDAGVGPDGRPPENLGELRNAHVDRGYGDSTRVASRDVAANRDTRPSQTYAVSSGSSSRDRAFSGADRDRDGSFDRAASARGHASASSRPARAARGGRGR
jgi:hypothetical protein